MGTSFTTTHIHNAQNLTKAQFKKAFTDMMKEKGYASCDKEDASVTYSLVFSPDLKWVTALTDRTDISREAADFALELRTKCVVIDLVDSDFAEISLFDEAGTHKDTLTLGNSYLEDAAPMGDPAAWQPLLSGSWEQMQEIQNGSYTFAEDALAQFAPLIGMDSGNVLLDNDSADDNAVVLHFKKAAEKKLTLNSAFVKVFGEALEPLGYAKINGKPVYAKILENGILHIIACQKGKGELGESVFGIYGTVSSVYDDNMFLILKEYDCLSYIGNMHIYTFIQKYNHIDFDNSYRFSLRHFIYESPDRSLTDVMNYALEISNKYLIPEIEEVKSYNDYILFSKKYNLRKDSLQCYYLSDDYEKVLRQYCEIRKRIVEFDYISETMNTESFTLNQCLEEINDVIEEKIGKIAKVFSDNERVNEIHQKMEDNKTNNELLLKEYGIIG